MIGWLLRIIWQVCWQFITAVLVRALGVLISCALRIGILFFRLSVPVTGWVLAYADIHLGRRISRRAITTLFASGGLWALIGFIAPLLFNLFTEGTAIFSLRLTTVGFIYGLVCGFRVRRISGWGMWAAEDGLQIGENSR